LLVYMAKYSLAGYYSNIYILSTRMYPNELSIYLYFYMYIYLDEEFFISFYLSIKHNIKRLRDFNF
jgi:hypothetical protein